MDAARVSELAQRVNQICTNKGLNANELSKELGVTSTAIYKILSGDTKNPSMDLLIKFHQRLYVNMLWLATGEGPVYVEGSERARIDTDASDYLQQYLIRLEEKFNNLVTQLSVKDTQIADLHEMLKLTLGKSKGSTKRPVSTQNSQLTIGAFA